MQKNSEKPFKRRIPCQSRRNQGFILMHSVGSLPNGSEIDTPLNYADYYYLEALKRFMDLKKLRLENGEVKVIE